MKYATYQRSRKMLQLWKFIIESPLSVKPCHYSRSESYMCWQIYKFNLLSDSWRSQDSGIGGRHIDIFTYDEQKRSLWVMHFEHPHIFFNHAIYPYIFLNGFAWIARPVPTRGGRTSCAPVATPMVWLSSNLQYDGVLKFNCTQSRNVNQLG